MRNAETQTARRQELKRMAAAENTQENLRSERIETMTREEMLAFAQRTAASLRLHEQWAIAQGVIEEGAYKWQDELFETSGVDIETQEDVARLADDDLRKIVIAYYC